MPHTSQKELVASQMIQLFLKGVQRPVDRVVVVVVVVALVVVEVVVVRTVVPLRSQRRL